MADANGDADLVTTARTMLAGLGRRRHPHIEALRHDLAPAVRRQLHPHQPASSPWAPSDDPDWQSWRDRVDDLWLLEVQAGEVLHQAEAVTTVAGMAECYRLLAAMGRARSDRLRLLSLEMDRCAPRLAPETVADVRQVMAELRRVESQAKVVRQEVGDMLSPAPTPIRGPVTGAAA